MSCFNANAVGKPCDRSADDDDSSQKPPSKPQTRKRSYSDEPSLQEMCYRAHHKTFPEKLYHILMKSEYNRIISFIPGGKAWKVHNRAKFESEVMEKHFESKKWASFLRQVTGWGFQRGEYSLDTDDVMKGNRFEEVFHIFDKRCIRINV